MKHVPNENKIAFKDMSPEEQLAIIQAKLNDKCEIWAGGRWVSAKGDGIICVGVIYRTRQRQLAIPWEHIKPEYKWAAKDEDGCLYVFTEKPQQSCDDWYPSIRGIAQCLDAFIIDTDGVSWEHSLVQRPENV